MLIPFPSDQLVSVEVLFCSIMYAQTKELLWGGGELLQEAEPDPPMASSYSLIPIFQTCDQVYRLRVAAVS